MHPYDINQLKIDSIQFSNMMILIVLRSGCTLRFPLSQGRFTNIRELDIEQQNNWLLVDENFGVYWPAIERQPQFVNQAMMNSVDLAWEKMTEQVLDNLSKSKWDFEKLSETEKDIVVLWRLEADIYNGGFMQFFANWGELDYQRCLVVLQKIQATETCKIVFQMHQVINRFVNDPEVNSITDIYGLLSQDENMTLGALDEAYWKDPDNLTKKAMVYFGEYFIAWYSNEK